MKPATRLSLWGLALCVVGIVTYFTVVTEFLAPYAPRLRNVPVLNLGIVAFGVLLSVRAWQGAPTRGERRLGAGLLGAVNVLLAGFFTWYLFAYSSRLPEAAAAPAVGTVAPDFELLDQAKTPVRMVSLRGRNVLLVFYRGHW